MTEEKVNVEEIEQQENHLRSKYGNIDKRKGSAMLNKKLRGNSKKYFDSGDYNMERERAAPKLAKNKVSNLVITGTKHNWLQHVIIPRKYLIIVKYQNLTFTI